MAGAVSVRTALNDFSDRIMSRAGAWLGASTIRLAIKKESEYLPKGTAPLRNLAG